jgi:hypothetical protein
MNYLIPVIIVLSLVKLVQLPEIRDEGWLLVFGIAGVAAVALAFNAGSLDGLVSFLSAKYTADKNLFFAWFLFCWFVMIYGLKRGSSFTTYNPINGYLYYNGKLIGKEDEKEDNFTPAKFKIKKRSWFSYLLLCGGLDYASKSAEDHEQNFGLAIAVFLWTCIYDDVEVVDGTSDIVIRRKFSLFNRAEYYGKDLNIEKKKRPTSIPQPKESSPVSSAAPVASVQTPVSTETEVQPEASEVNPQNKIPQTTPQPTEKKPGFFSRLIQRLKKK